MNNESFVYRWRNKRTRQWYIGYHTGTTDDGYICSSKIALPLIKSDSEQWSRKVLRHGSRIEMIDLERRLLSRLQARTNTLSLNRSNGNGTLYSGRGYKTIVHNLNKLTADQIAQAYKNCIDSGNLQDRFRFDHWLVSKCVLKGSLTRPLRLNIVKYLHV